MKSRTLTYITAMTWFAALAIPLRLPAQEQQQNKQKPRYKLIDLGTLGGPASYPVFLAQVLNNHGMVTGGADTSTPDPNAQNCFNLDCFVSHTFEWRNGVMTDLGALPGVNSSGGNWINARGDIVGLSQNSTIDPLTGFPETVAVLWKDGKIVNLGTLGGNESVAQAVNNRGQVVGGALNAIPDPFSFFTTQIRAFLWENGQMQDLGTLGGPEAFALFVNEPGQATGFSFTNWTPNPATGIPTQDPFLWENGKMTDVGTLGGTFGFANSLNNRGQVAGDSNLAGDTATHPFFWDREGMIDLGTFGGNFGDATWISDEGDVVGVANFPGDQMWHAFLWRRGVMNDLGTVTGDTCSQAESIGSKGQVVGASGICFQTARAFVWEKGGPMLDLNSLIPRNSSLLLVNALDIHDRGEIAGIGVPPGVPWQDANSRGHAFLLIPCEGDNSDAHGCADTPEATNGAIQNNPAPSTETSTNVTQGRPISQMSDTLRTRFGRRYRGLIWPGK